VPNKLGKTSEIISAHLNSNKTISKSAFSIFGSVDFTNHLKELNINHLILTGIETSICIYLSAIDALKRDMKSQFYQIVLELEEQVTRESH
jgi:isochorismate hydrolase